MGSCFEGSGDRNRKSAERRSILVKSCICARMEARLTTYFLYRPKRHTKYAHEPRPGADPHQRVCQLQRCTKCVALLFTVAQFEFTLTSGLSP